MCHIKASLLSSLLLLLIPILLTAQNIALNKKYTLSVPPNYQQTGSDSDHNTLTDGIFTKEAFWARTTTIGWVRQQVTITIDLGKIQPVGSVALNTCRNQNVGIDFPSNIYVFSSLNNIDFIYNGDAAETPENVAGPYEVKKFCLNTINKNARYISIVVVPDGPYFFTDEIEVYPGRNKTTGRPQLISKSKIEVAVDSLKWNEFERKNLERKISALQEWQFNPDKKRERLLSGYKKTLAQSGISKNRLASINKSVETIRVSNLAKHFSKPFIVEKVNPWDSIDEIHSVKNAPDTLRYQFLIPVSNVQYGGFVITNLDKSAKNFSISVDGINNHVVNTEIFNVPFVPSLNFSKVADPLIVLNQQTKIDEGVSAVFLFKVTGLAEGIDQFQIIISSEGHQIPVVVDTRVLKSPGSDVAELNAIVWAYLHFPMIKDRQREAGEDLFEHHINTIDLTPEILPGIDKTDSTKLINYLKNLKGIENFLILPNYSDAANRNGYKGGRFMSPDWKIKFKVWYQNIVDIIKKNGFPESQVLFYPYDEVRGKDISDFKQLMIWAKEAVPKIKFYATLGNKPAVDALLPLLDVAQIHSDYKGIDDLPRHRGEVWIYSVRNAARSLSPYNYYRLMAWRAFANDFKGIGFWNYADEGRGKTLNLISDPFINPASSFSVIYDGPGKEIISSRRWEAFRLGIEDYAIIAAYSKKFGNAKAKEMAKQVIENPEEIDKADQIRNEMITELVGDKL